MKLIQQRDTKVESCEPNPCLHDGKCISTGSSGRCQCPGQWTGLMCALTVCELAPCVFGECSVTKNGGYKCKCQLGYNGPTCDQKQRPCEGNPCESRGDCIGKFFINLTYNHILITDISVVVNNNRIFDNMEKMLNLKHTAFFPRIFFVFSTKMLKRIIEKMRQNTFIKYFSVY